MMLRWTKRALSALAVVAVAVAAYYALQPTPVLVDTSQVDRGLVEVTINEDGVTRIEDVFEVSAPITGKLERLGFEVGDLVEKGQKIAVVRPVDPPMRDARTRRELEAALKAARAGIALGEAEVARSEAAVRFSSLDLARQKTLAKQRIISERVLQQAELELETRNAQLRQAKANLEFRKREFESAQARVLEPSAALTGRAESQCCVDVLAPSSGALLKLFGESERVVQAGTKLVEIGDRSKIEIVADLLSEDAVKAKAGDLVWIENWGGPEKLRAKVKRIDPSGFMKVSALGIEEQRVNTIIQITEPRKNWVRLGHDFRVYVRIVIWRSETALRIPVSALFRRGNDWAVFVMEGERAVERKVEIGHRSETHAEVTSGLQEGQIVVLHPSDRISDQTRIEKRS